MEAVAVSFYAIVLRVFFAVTEVILSNIRRCLVFVYYEPFYQDWLTVEDETPKIKPKKPKDNDTPQLDGEYVFRDTVEFVARYADAKSLAHMAVVSRSWRSAAQRESKKRFHLIQFLGGTFNSLQKLSNLKGTPFVSLFFYRNPRLRPPNDDNTRDITKYLSDHKILEKYRGEMLMPNLAITVKVDYFFSIEREILCSLPRRINSPEDRDMQGLFFPSLPGVVYHTATLMHVDTPEPEDIVERLTEKLGFNDDNCKSKSTILMFAVFTMPTYCDILNELFKRQAKKGRQITFAGFYGTKIRATEDDRSCICCGDMRKLLRISGPRMESWSTFIRFDEGFSEIRRKLNDLKMRVKRKRNFLGLVYAPRCKIPRCLHHSHLVRDSVKFMKIISSTFHYIKFRGYFVYDDEMVSSNPFYVVQRLTEDRGLFEKQGSPLHASIIIIGHD